MMTMSITSQRVPALSSMTSLLILPSFSSPLFSLFESLVTLVFIEGVDSTFEAAACGAVETYCLRQRGVSVTSPY